MMQNPTKTHKGSCHCGKVSFELITNLKPALRSDCLICKRKGGTLSIDPICKRRGEVQAKEHGVGLQPQK